MNILIVFTSHNKLGNTDQPTGFWLEEFATPYYVFQNAGAQITLASPKGGQPPQDPKSDAEEFQSELTRKFLQDSDGHAALARTKKLAEIDENYFDAVFYPGGHGPMWDLVEDEHSIRIIEGAFNAGKPVAALCHGPCVFRHAKDAHGSSIVSDKQVTCFTNSEEAAVELTHVVPFLVEDMLKENGARFSNAGNFMEHCVVDGNIITGQNPASSDAVARALLQQLH